MTGKQIIIHTIVCKVNIGALLSTTIRRIMLFNLDDWEDNATPEEMKEMEDYNTSSLEGSSVEQEPDTSRVTWRCIGECDGRPLGSCLGHNASILRRDEAQPNRHRSIARRRATMSDMGLLELSDRAEGQTWNELEMKYGPASPIRRLQMNTSPPGVSIGSRSPSTERSPSPH